MFDPASMDGNLPVPLAYTPELIREDGATLRSVPDIFGDRATVFQLYTGMSLLAAVRQVYRSAGLSIPSLRRAVAFVSDGPGKAPYEVKHADWAEFIIRQGMDIQVCYRFRGGGGGKNPLSTILSIVVMVAAAVATWYIGGTGAFAGISALGLGTTAGALAGTAVMIGGMMLVNALCPPTTPKISGDRSPSAEKVWSVEGVRNRFIPNEPLPLPLGKVRYAPPHIARYYTYREGKTQFGRYLFGVAGVHKTSKHRVGDQPIEGLKNVKLNEYRDWKGEEFEFFKNAVIEEQLGVVLTGSNGRQTRTSAVKTSELQFEIAFPRGLGEMTTKKGKRYGRSITFNVEYRPVGTTEWRGFYGYAACLGGKLTIPAPPDPTSNPTKGGLSTSAGDNFTVSIDADGNPSFAAGTAIATGSWSAVWEARNVGSFLQPVYRWQRVAYSVSVTPDDHYNGAVTASTETGAVVIDVTEGSYNKKDLTVSSGFTITPFAHGGSKIVSVGQYEMSITRITGNANPNNPDSTVFDETQWTIMRSILPDPPLIYDNRPMTVFEMQIQATEQLSGHVDEFNAVFESICPVWNGSEWVQEASNNPAWLGMMIATSRVTEIPAAPEDLDEPSWIDFGSWCDEMGWRYNTVITGEATARDLLLPVLSAGRGSITMFGERVGVAWDAPGKPVTMNFGPRNSWGFQGHKEFTYDPVHGLRYQFLNEAVDFQEDERTVYADGYDETNAENIKTAEQEGVTNPDLIWKHGRLRLADLIWRPETYSFNTDYGYLKVQKGDRISVTHDVPRWGIQQARVLRVIPDDIDFTDMPRAQMLSLCNRYYQKFISPSESTAEFSARINGMDSDDLRAMLDDSDIQDEQWAKGVVIDSIVTMEAGKTYGFIYFPAAGKSIPYSVATRDISDNVLLFQTVIPFIDAPAPDGLIHFGEAGKETHDLVVVGFEPVEDLCAKIVCQDYSADEVYASIAGEIPPWDSNITIPSRWKIGQPLVPIVNSIRTDEAVLQQLGDGSLVPRIQVGFSLRLQEGIDIRKVYVQVRRSGEGEEWAQAGEADASQGYVYATGVEELTQYDVRIYATSALGIGSDYSPTYTATVIGRTTPPPPPNNIFLDGSRVWWTMPDDYPVDVRGWEVWMSFDAHDPFSSAVKLTSPHTTEMQFDVARWSGWARRIWVRTIDDVGLTSTAVSYTMNLGMMPVENVVLDVWEGENRNWPGKVQSGTLIPGVGLVSAAGRQMWGDTPMWGNVSMWGGDVQPMIYTTSLQIPAEGLYSNFRINVVMASGALASVEYGIGSSYPMWGDRPMWGNLPFMGLVMPDTLQVMTNDVWVSDSGLITVRIITGTNEPAIISEIQWVFDVEDREVKIGGLEVPAEGMRVPVEPKEFRWIKTITFGAKSMDDEGSAVISVWSDRGISDGEFITEGPLIRLRDSANNSVAGVVDVTIQGAKGV